MNILFEGYSYPKDKVNLPDYLDEQYVNRDNSTSYVGYFHGPAKKGIDNITFILPKVFMEVSSKDGKEHFKKPFGRDDKLPEEFLTASLLDEEEREFLFNFSMWIQSAIEKYATSRNDKDRAIDMDLDLASSRTGGNQEKTLLEIAMSLREYHREHQHLLTYITRLNSVGDNNIDWQKTISSVQPIFQIGAPVYMEFRNRTKEINFDEELIVLYYSVLNYMSEKYSLFHVKTPVNYDILSSSDVQDMIDQGTGTVRLWKIRKKYFTDELVELWNLVYNFFEHSESIAFGNIKNEYLLINKFECVFEAMVDDLLNNIPDNFPISKKQEDGKRLDHLFEGLSLLAGSKHQVFYIGDSKYYLDQSDIAENSVSVSKEYTYAKNIIQYAINDSFKKSRSLPKNYKYRDDLTEGYTITPNFFLRGAINFIDGKISNYNNESFIEPIDSVQFEKNKQFNDRLFDRDTLLLKAFNINFLTLLSLYIADETTSMRDFTQSKIFSCLLYGITEQYDFYRVYPALKPGESLNRALEQMCDAMFREYVGTMFHDNDNDPFIWVALVKNPNESQHNISDLLTNPAYSKFIDHIKKAEFNDGRWTPAF